MMAILRTRRQQLVVDHPVEDHRQHGLHTVAAAGSRRDLRRVPAGFHGRGLSSAWGVRATFLLVPLPLKEPLWALAFAIAAAGCWADGDHRGHLAEKFDHWPRSRTSSCCRHLPRGGLLLGQHAAPFWQAVSRLNPFFYAVDGFRYGFFAQSDVPPATSLAIATAAFAALSWLTLLLIRSGYKLRQ